MKASAEVMKRFEELADMPAVAEPVKPTTSFPSIAGEPEERFFEDVRAPEFVEITQENLNLETELLTQYNSARRLIHDSTYSDAEVPVNQKAQAVNAATTILASLIKSQAELYSLERVKKIESVLIAVLKDFPELQERFFESYEKALA